jgi:hypothetical protein
MLDNAYFYDKIWVKRNRAYLLPEMQKENGLWQKV